MKSEQLEHFGFWIAIVILILFILILIFLNIYSYANPKCPSCSLEQQYGVKLNTSGNLLNKCGTTGNDPCQFNKNSLSEAFVECNSQGSLCQTFDFVPSNSNTSAGIMRILDPNSLFSSDSLIFIKN